MSSVTFYDTLNALRDDHLADYIVTKIFNGVRADLSETDRHASQNKKKFIDSVLQLYDCETSPTLHDKSNNVHVQVEALMTAQKIKSISCIEFLSEDDDIFPVAIKNTTLDHKKNKNVLCSAQQVNIQKARLAYACNALGKSCGFIVGNGNKWGLVDFENEDANHMRIAKKAADWAHLFKETHIEMSIDPPSCEELYPNMKVATKDCNIQQYKKKLALKNNEMTLIRYIGTKQRSIALYNGITSWKDPRLNAKLIGFKTKKVTDKHGEITAVPNGAIVDTILKANQNTSFPKQVRPRPHCCNEKDIFLDIETLLNTDCPDIPDYVFMIGVGYVENGEDKFVCLRAEEITLEEELKITKQFLDLVQRLNAARTLHWGQFEEKVFKKVGERHRIQINSQLNLFDMCKYIERNDYCPRGSFNFSLKSIVPAMYKHKLISTIWDSECTDGNEAAVRAFHAYKNGVVDVLNDIKEYNKIDVVSTMDIWKYLVSIGILM